ncbi:hypothetical protein CEXT_234661, partial [Caerostris extrusa]
NHIPASLKEENINISPGLSVMETSTSIEVSNSYVTAPPLDCTNVFEKSYNSDNVDQRAVAAKTDELRYQLTSTGDLYRLKHLLHRRLIETGWETGMLAKVRGIASYHGPMPYAQLFDIMKDCGIDAIPISIKNEMFLKMKACYEASLSADTKEENN